jgi:hypothetical protein
LQDEALFGQSGAPVFDTGGMVVGMQASVMAPRSSVGGKQNRKITVESAVAISSDKIVAMYEKTFGLRTVVPKIDIDADLAEERRRA